MVETGKAGPKGPAFLFFWNMAFFLLFGNNGQEKTPCSFKVRNMTEKENRRSLVSLFPMFILVGLFVFLSGCAGLKTAEDRETALRDRVQAYWQHKVNKEFAEAYLMESPEVRNKTSLTKYITGLGGGVIWMGVKLESVSMEEDYAKVWIDLTYALFGMPVPKKGITRKIPDCWKLVDGQWYHMPACPKEKKKPGGKSK